MVLVWSVAPSLNLKNLIFFQVTVQSARKLAIKGKFKEPYLEPACLFFTYYRIHINGGGGREWSLKVFKTWHDMDISFVVVVEINFALEAGLMII